MGVEEGNERGRNLGMDGAREEASGGERDQRSGREERGRKGHREGGKLQGMYPEEDTGQYTVYREQNNTQRSPCHCDLGFTIVNGYINSVL